MPTILLRPGYEGSLAEIPYFFFASSMLEALGDGNDNSYGETDPTETTSLFYLEDHGLPDGTAINAVTLYYRGQVDDGGLDSSFTGACQRGEDQSYTNDVHRADIAWTTYSLSIPAPTGGWNLDELALLQIGATLQGTFAGAGPPYYSRMADVWAVVEYTEPAAFIPHGCCC